MIPRRIAEHSCRAGFNPSTLPQRAPAIKLMIAASLIGQPNGESR